MKFRVLFFGLLALEFLAGCEWSPVRDNPRDPGAWYNPPETIQKLWIETHCRWDREDICYMTVFAKVRDPEGISTLDKCWIYLADTLLGQMEYDSPSELFALSIWAKSDTLPQHLFHYQTKYFIVRFQDDKANITEDSTRISRVICSGMASYPEIVWPDSANNISPTSHPILEWRLYSGEFDFTCRIQCFRGNQETLVWDTSGISREIDSVRVSVPLESSQGEEGFYCWKLAVVDDAGNTAESECARFWVFY